MLFPFINQLQEIACNQVKDDCQEDNVDVDGNEEDQPGLAFFKSCKSLLDVEDDQGGQQSEQN